MILIDIFDINDPETALFRCLLDIYHAVSGLRELLAHSPLALAVAPIIETLNTDPLEPGRLHLQLNHGNIDYEQISKTLREIHEAMINLYTTTLQYMGKDKTLDQIIHEAQFKTSEIITKTDEAQILIKTINKAKNNA